MDKERLQAAVREILLAVGEDPDRPGLVETPRRVADMYAEVFAGLETDPRQHLKFFEEKSTDEMVIVRDIPFASMCEHHLLPFVGKAHIAYIPADNRIIGLSKFARIVDCFARRPQVQERGASPQGRGGDLRGGAYVYEYAWRQGCRQYHPNLRVAGHYENGRAHPRRGAGTADQVRSNYGCLALQRERD